MKTAEKILFLVSFLAAFIGIASVLTAFASYLVIIGAVIYLFVGWYLLLPDAPGNSERWIPFIVGYLTSQTLITVLFGLKDWPLGETMAYVTILMTLVTIVLLWVSRNRLKNIYPIDGYIVRMIVCSMFSGSPLWIS